MSHDNGVCPKCGSRSCVGSCDIAIIFEKRGSNLVRKRGVKSAVFDWVCEACGHKWSSRICISKIRFRGLKGFFGKEHERERVRRG